MAAGGPKAAELAGRVGDGYIGTAPATKVIQAFEQAGGAGKPKYGQVTVCWAPDEQAAIQTAHEWWPNAAMPGQLSQELPTPAHFQQTAKLVRPEDIAEAIVCGPDPEMHAAKIREYADAGYDHVYVHQVGPDQEGFFRFYEREVLPLVA